MAYTKEQLALIKTLVDTEKCTVTQITAITGVPRGSVANLVVRSGTKLTGAQKPGKSHLARINEARKIVHMLEKYDKQLRAHFGKAPDAP